MGFILCVIGFVAAFFLGRISLVAGLGTVLTFGYFYGILRANFPVTASHFIFDATVLGFYLSQIDTRLKSIQSANSQALFRWMTALLAWAIVMFLVPMQHFLIQLVGLRGNAFLVPFVIFGALLQTKDLMRLAVWIAVLNLLAICFGLAEYFIGVRAFFPENSVTEIIYNSHDVAGNQFMRIPGTFVTAHAFAGAMVATIPWLVGTMVQPRMSFGSRSLLAGGALAAMLAIFLTATRLPFVVLAVLVIIATFSGRLRAGALFGLILLLVGVGYIVSNHERLQRFMTLSDTEQVYDRVHGSMNLSFFDLVVQYPMGNGMGAGGTSIPHFLREYLGIPIYPENEFGRLLLEQGLPGLALWVAFIAWVLNRGGPSKRHPWYTAWRLLWYYILVSVLTSCIGLGLMTTIPQSALFFLSLGVLVGPLAAGAGAARPMQNTRSIALPGVPVEVA